MSTPVENRLDLGRKVTYAAPAFALAIVGIPIYVYIPKFYTDVVGINIALMGTILLSVRLFDAITDPIIGGISDATRSRFGRRRPYLALGSLLLAAALLMLFIPPRSDVGAVTIWFGIAVYAVFLFWTVVTVPYESLGPEISFDYHERTSLFSMRDGFLIAGTLAAASSPALVDAIFGLGEGPQDQRRKFFYLAIVYAPLVMITCWWCASKLKERPRSKGQSQARPRLDIRAVARNRPFIILLAAYTISAIGNNLPATLILYYVQYVLQSSYADLFLFLYFVVGILFLPFWIGVSKRVGKKYAWIGAMVVNTGAFIGVFFLGAGDELAYGVLVVLSGIGFGATLALPSAIQADVIDYDELLSGRRREGLYIGLWSVSKKLAAAAGVGIGLGLLGVVGYTPNVQQSETVLFTLRTLYALVPSICNVLGILIVLLYPISDRVHRRIRDAIGQRLQGEHVADPLTGRALEPYATLSIGTALDASTTEDCHPERLQTATDCTY